MFWRKRCGVLMVSMTDTIGVCLEQASSLISASRGYVFDLRRPHLPSRFSRRPGLERKEPDSRATCTRGIRCRGVRPTLRSGSSSSLSVIASCLALELKLGCEVVLKASRFCERIARIARINDVSSVSTTLVKAINPLARLPRPDGPDATCWGCRHRSMLPSSLVP